VPNKKLSCRRKAAHCFVSLNISQVTQPLKLIGNKTIRQIAHEFPLALHSVMALCCIVSEIKRDIGGKSQFFTTPWLRHTSWRSPSEHCNNVCHGKTEMVDPSDGEMFENMFRCFDTISASDRQTDCHRQTCILPRHSPRLCRASSGKNKQLSCRREAVRCFVAFNISLSRSRSLKLIRNDTVQQGVC